MNRKVLAGVGSLSAATLLFGAAALAQTPNQGVMTIAQATSTATSVVTGTATTVVTGTVVAGSPTVVSTSTVQPVPTVPIATSIYQAGGTGNFPYAHPAFLRTWERTDRVVNEGRVQRTYLWGPGPNTPGLLEQYNESPRGDKLRLVQYFDKSRMEINNPGGDQGNPFFVTNGLLTVDLISGSVQVGDNEFVKYRNACIPMSGDFGDQIAPTYFAFQRVSVSGDRIDTHPATSRVGQSITATIDRNGNVGNDPSKGNDPQVRVSVFVSETKHNIPVAFWDFLNSRGPVYVNGRIVEERIFEPLFFATGYPVSEPYWARATIRGQVRDVMIQAFERRALTYVPTNEAGFRVEMANIGQHYFDWRYRNFGFCPNEPARTPTPPVPAPTGTVVSGTPGATGTPVRTGTVVSGTNTPTAITTPPGTIVPNPSATPTVQTTQTMNVPPGTTVTPQGTPVP